MVNLVNSLSRFCPCSRIGIVFLGIFFSIPPLHSATWNVTTLTDSGTGSLRQTLANAAPGDTISIPLQGTIVLTNGKLVLSKNITIAGPTNGKVQIDARKTSSIIAVVTNVTVRLSDLTLINGTSYDSNSVISSRAIGGGIQNFGTLYMTRCVVTGCHAYDGAGGGIFSSGPLFLTQCSISNNTATLGGGICDYGKGQLTLQGCTVNANRTSGSSGDDGGGIFKVSGSLTLTNSTISQNSSHDGVGGIAAGGTVNLTSCTVVSNRSSSFAGGIATASQLACKNSIIANNSSIGLPNGWDVSGTILSGGYNLIRDTNGSTITGTTTGNIHGANPLLGPLQNNGGVTWTHLPLTNSPAIDRGNGSGLNLDQRGYTRAYDMAGVSNLGDGVDMGAIEAGSSSPSTTPPTPPPPSTAWTPLSLGPKVLVWVEPTNSFKDTGMKTRSTMNDIVRVLVNMGSGKFHFTNSETARKTAPYLNANRPGGFPTLFYEGNIANNAPIPYPAYHNDCGYLTSGLQPGLIHRPFTVYWVGCRWTVGDRMIGSYWGTGYDSYNGMNTENTCYDNGGGIWFNSNAGASIASYGGQYAKMHLFRAVLTSGMSEVTVDGKPCIRQSGGTSPLYGLVLGSRRGPAAGERLIPGDHFSHSLGGDMGTFILIQGTVSDAEHTSITNWLNKKYGGLPR